MTEVPPNPSVDQFQDIPVNINRDVDILFVIDDSGSMDAEQTALAAAFPEFINVLESIDGGLPDVHIGVISTDIGAGTSCAGGGRGGVLQNQPRQGCALSGPDDRYIVSLRESDTTRIENFPTSQTLADTFACIARLGTEGCGFEQPLEAMRMALDSSNTANAGFLRDSAHLAVIFISDEDDCSAADDTVFTGNETPELGIPDSFRCFEFGIQCDPDNPRTVGVKNDCRPRQNSRYLHGVDRYIDFLQGLKPDPNSLVMVAGILGAPAPVVVEEISRFGRDVLNLRKSCGRDEADENKGAVPALRTQAVLAAFPGTSAVTSICNENELSDALVVIGEKLKLVVGNSCLQGDLVDTDDQVAGLQPECTVSLVRNPNTDAQQETRVFQCDETSTPTADDPCYQLTIDPDNCANQPTHLAIHLEPEEFEAPTGTHLFVHCLAR